MQKKFYSIFIFVVICFLNSMHCMHRKLTSEVTTDTSGILFPIDLTDDLLPVIASQCKPKMKKSLKCVCKLFNACLKNTALLIRLNLKTVSYSDKLKCMFACACNGDEETMKLLLTIAKMNPNEGNSLGMMPLHYAMENNRRNIILLLIKHGADVDEPKPLIYPLHDAVFKGDKEYVQSLLAHDVDPNRSIGNRKTALDIAKYEGHSEIAQILRESGGREKNEMSFRLEDFMMGPIFARDFRKIIDK